MKCQMDADCTINEGNQTRIDLIEYIGLGPEYKKPFTARELGDKGGELVAGYRWRQPATTVSLIDIISLIGRAKHHVGPDQGLFCCIR